MRDNMIKAIRGGAILPVTQDADIIAVFLRSNNLSAATHFDKRVSRDPFPQGMGKRQWVSRDLGGVESSERKGWIELCVLFRGGPGSQRGA
jgi:hypothetical protein